jgi:hypothetical protein
VGLRLAVSTVVTTLRTVVPDRSDGSLWRLWRRLRWHEQLAVAITGTSVLASSAVASVFAALSAQLLFEPGGQGGPDVIIVPVAVVVGTLLLGQTAVLAVLAAVQALAMWLALRRKPAGYWIASACLGVSAVALLRVGDATAMALRAPLAGIWLAGACLAVASLFRREAAPESLLDPKQTRK